MDSGEEGGPSFTLKSPLVEASSSGDAAAVEIPIKRPSRAVAKAEWDRAVALSMEALHPVSLFSGCRFCCIALLGWVVTVVALVVTYVELKWDSLYFGLAMGGSVLVWLVLGIAMTSHIAVPARRPDPAVPRATFVEDGVDMGPDHSKPLRTTLVDELVTRPSAEISTLADLWRTAVRDHGASRCHGRREVLKKITKRVTLTNKDGSTREKLFKKLILAPEYQWETYAQANTKVQRLARFLSAEMGKIRGDKPRHVGIYASTSPDWHQTAQACFASGVTLGTVYATLGADGLAYAAHLAEMSVLFAEPETLGHIATVMSKAYTVEDGEGGEIECSKLREIATVVVVNGSLAECDREHVAAIENRSEELGGPIRLLDFSTAVEEGGTLHKDVAVEAPSPEDTAVLMFTSGSTGLPKGVQVLHSNLVAAVAALRQAIPGFQSDDVFIAYLPLAHILELAAELCTISVGAALGYGSPFTLTRTSPMVAQPGDDPDVPEEGVDGDATALRPTVMAGVPAVYEKVRKKLTARFENATGAAKFLWDKAWGTKSTIWADYQNTPFWDRLFFDKLRTAALGGRVRVLISGGGPLAKETQLFMNVCFRAPLGQGWGLTETCGGGTVFWPDDRSLGRIGVPIPSMDIKLIAWEEGGYTVKPDANSPYPQGELCLAGANVCKGYYKNPAKTAEAFVEEGGRVWFRTGDIGQIDPDGWVRIIDRKKDLVKLSRGEYVALGATETVAKLAPVVLNLCAYGDSLKEFIVGLVTVNRDALPEEFADLHDDDIVGNEAVAKFVQREVAKVGKGRLSKEGIPGKIAVVGVEEWQPPTGLVTASMKLQRKAIQRRFQAEIDALYGDGAGAAGK